MSYINTIINAIMQKEMSAELRTLFTELSIQIGIKDHPLAMSKCIDCGEDLKFDKHSISLNDKDGTEKDLSFMFCENCGYTSNVEFS